MSDRFRVSEASTLLPFLTTKLQGWARNKIKQRLQTGCVQVNGQPIKKHDQPLKAGDEIEVTASPKNPLSQTLTRRLEILFSDADLIAINKPAGLLSVASATETHQHALALLRNQLSRPGREVKLWPVHRLDRDTSGVLLFATSREMREAVNAHWDDAEKIYLAIVEGCPNPDRGTIDQPLRMDENEYFMHVGAHPEAKHARTRYQTERSQHGRSLLRVELETGRQHQIRAHLSWLGYPVIGDPRYGTAGPRLGLHALQLSCTHPGSGRRLSFETPAPADFFSLLG